MIVGVPKRPSPARRALPWFRPTIAALKKAGLDVRVQSSAGLAAGFPDQHYLDKGAQIAAAATRSSPPTSSSRSGWLGPISRPAGPICAAAGGQLVIGFVRSVGRAPGHRGVALGGDRCSPWNCSPASPGRRAWTSCRRSHRGRLPSGAPGRWRLPKMFPMMITAGRHITPARVLVVGAGVAGLQAIATAYRLGANRLGLRRPPGRQGAGAEPGGQIRGNAPGNAAAGSQGWLRPIRWTRSSTGNSAS